jgi:putative phosphoesterase
LILRAAGPGGTRFQLGERRRWTPVSFYRQALLMAYSALQVGLISDTHGLLRPQATAALHGSNFIVHAGDIGDSSILDRLSKIAPTTAVRGNNDKGTWASRVPQTEVLQVGAVLIYIVHDLAQLEIDPAASGFHVVVSGHSHRPVVEWRDGVLFINPGSAGPRRFKLPVSVATLTIAHAVITPRLVELNVHSNA